MHLVVDSIAYRFGDRIRYEVWVDLVKSSCEREKVEEICEAVSAKAEVLGFVRDAHRPRWILEGTKGYDDETLLQRGKLMKDILSMEGKNE